MTTLSDHTERKSHDLRGVTATHRMIIGAVIGLAVIIGAGFWAYRGSVVFTELVDLALAYCF